MIRKGFLMTAMFRYYNHRLIISNRSYSTEKIQKLLGIHEQTIREWL